MADYFTPEVAKQAAYKADAEAIRKERERAAKAKALSAKKKLKGTAHEGEIGTTEKDFINVGEGRAPRSSKGIEGAGPSVETVGTARGTSVSGGKKIVEAARMHKEEVRKQVAKIAKLQEQKSKLYAGMEKITDETEDALRLGNQRAKVAQEMIRTEQLETAKGLKDVTKRMLDRKGLQSEGEMYSQLPTAQKIMMGVSSFMDGFKMAGGGPDAAKMSNAFQKYYQRQIDQDIKIGTAEAARAQEEGAALKSVMASYLQMGLNEKQAVAATEAFYGNLLENEGKRMLAKGAPADAAMATAKFGIEKQQKAVDAELKAGKFLPKYTSTRNIIKEVGGVQEPVMEAKHVALFAKVNKLTSSPKAQIEYLNKQGYDYVPLYSISSTGKYEMNPGYKDLSKKYMASAEFVKSITGWGKSVFQMKEKLGNIGETAKQMIKAALQIRTVTDANGEKDWKLAVDDAEFSNKLENSGLPKEQQTIIYSHIHNMRRRFMEVTRKQLKAMGDMRPSDKDVELLNALPTGAWKWDRASLAKYIIGRKNEIKNDIDLYTKNKLDVEQIWAMPFYNNFKKALGRFERAGASN